MCISILSRAADVYVAVRVALGISISVPGWYSGILPRGLPSKETGSFNCYSNKELRLDIIELEIG